MAAVLTPTVYIVDDEESVRRAVGRLLKAEGMRVRAYASAEEFLDSGPEKAAILVLDIRMPGMSGLELRDRLTAQGAAIPTIFITAHDDEETRAAALRTGAVAFLVKPFEDDALLAAIDEASRKIG